tara:strand:+ start:95 stop:316 length:222 start_codon:yes stop_codon:yes gene_type:complete
VLFIFITHPLFKKISKPPLWYKGGAMDYLYINEKGKYERMENRKELKRSVFFLLGLSFLCLLLGFGYLVLNNF